MPKVVLGIKMHHRNKQHVVILVVDDLQKNQALRTHLAAFGCRRGRFQKADWYSVSGELPKIGEPWIIRAKTIDDSRFN